MIVHFLDAAILVGSALFLCGQVVSMKDLVLEGIPKHGIAQHMFNGRGKEIVICNLPLAWSAGLPIAL